jgi:hypothetical protein
MRHELAAERAFSILNSSSSTMIQVGLQTFARRTSISGI